MDVDELTLKPTSRNYNKGTIHYLAPEVIDLKFALVGIDVPLPYETAVNVWALGLTAFEMLIGRFACDRNTHTSRIGESADFVTLDRYKRQRSDDGSDPEGRETCESCFSSPTQYNIDRTNR